MIPFVDSVWAAVIVLCYPLTWLLIPWVLLKPVSHPSARVAWLLTIIFVPYFGALACLVFGVNRVTRKVRGQQQVARQIRKELPEPPSAGEPDAPPHIRAIYRVAKQLTGEPLTSNNRLQIFDRTPDTFAALTEAMRGAKKTLHVSYYLWREDKIGTEMTDILIERSRAGVEVRFLYDEIGSLWLPRKTKKKLKAEGVEVAGFLAGAGFVARWSLNLRSHRKIVVIDGQTAFTGGVNVGDEYLGRDPGYGYWRDTHLRVDGPAAARLQRVFAEDWFFATGKRLTDPKYYDARPVEEGDADLQVLPDGPADDKELLHDMLFIAIANATDRVTVATGYFVPSESLFTALTTAARRGVNVRVLTAGKNTYIHTLLAGRAFYERLLAAGVEVYEYERGLFHSKTTTVDGVWSVIGTANFDLRSLVLNFEDVVMSYDPRVAEHLERQFAEDVTHSRKFELDSWKQRSVWNRLGEEGCQIFAPVL